MTGHNDPDFIDIEIITSLIVTCSKGSRPPLPFSFPKTTQKRYPLARTISCVILVDVSLVDWMIKLIELTGQLVDWVD